MIAPTRPLTGFAPSRGLFYALLFIGLPMWLPAADVIIAGSGGDPEYREKFADWAVQLRQTLVDQMQRSKQEISVFLEPPVDRFEDVRPVDLDALRLFFSELAKNHQADRDLYIYLIGHGSYLNGTTSFQIPGPDLNPAELKHMIDPIPAKRVILIHGGSVSAGFINELSGPNRVLVTAAKSVRELYATEFPGFLIQALREGIADRNRDERISVWEACRQAASLTEAWYRGRGLIATEHAILDDNGDGLGTRLYEEPPPEEAIEPRDGLLARQCFIKDFAFPSAAPPELIQTYLSLLDQVQTLKADKKKLAAETYYLRLERLFVAAAQAHRDIRAYRNEEETRLDSGFIE